MQGRVCTRCRIHKDAASFHTNGTHSDGSLRLRSICRACGGGRRQNNTDPKVCPLCEKLKPASEFQQKGTYTYCRPCNTKQVAARRRPGGSQHKKHIEYVGARYKKKYATDPMFRQQVAARHAVQAALIDGDLVRPPLCQNCFQPKRLTAHHYLGYEREHRLDVLWLCHKCHYDIEKEN